MRTHYLLISIVAIAVLIAGYALLPRPEEHVTMLARDGLYELASQELSALRNAGDRRPHILMQTHLLLEKQGDHAGAISTLEAYLSVRPTDIAAREKHAELLHQSGSLEQHFEALASLAAMHPSSERIDWLVSLYRLHSRFDDELTLLRRFAGSNYLAPAHLERLGALLAARGEWAAAERWLQLADDGAPSDAISVRLLLFEVLLQGNRAAEAYHRARAWMIAWRSPYLSGKLILRTAQAGLGAWASELARMSLEANPEAVFEIAAVLTRKGHATISRQMLAQWVEREPNPSGEQLRKYVYASAQVGDVQGPFTKLARVLSSGAEPVTQARFAEEIASGYGKAALAPLRSLLSPRILLTRPLFAAELALFEENAQLARWFLAHADPVRLAPEQRLQWLNLLRRVESRPAVFERLVRLWDAKRLPPELLRAFADEARQLGQSRMHDSIWAALRLGSARTAPD